MKIENEQTTGDIIRELMRKRNMSQLELAKRIGAKGQSNISEYLKRDMKFSLFEKMLDVLGYEVVIRPKTDTTEW